MLNKLHHIGAQIKQTLRRMVDAMYAIVRITGLMVVMATLTHIFLELPDIDHPHSWLAILNHRSIITHSLLPLLILAIVFYYTNRYWQPKHKIWFVVAAIGAAVGLSAHLLADMLAESMQGFAMIYLPPPWDFSIGKTYSYLWLLGNACVGYFIAFFLARRYTDQHGFMPCTLLLSIAIGVRYGLENEQSILSAFVSVIIPVLMLFAVEALNAIYKPIKCDNDT